MVRFIVSFCVVTFFYSQLVAQTWQQIITNQNDTIGLYNALVKSGLDKSEFDGIIRSKLYTINHPSVQITSKGASFKISDTNSTCVNMDFEDSTYTGWSGRKGFHPLINPGCCAQQGFFVNSHTIVVGGTDPTGGFPRVAPGGTASFMLGSTVTGGIAEQLKQTFMVNADNKAFTYSYAVVLQDPQHLPTEQPFFEIIMYDQNGDTIPCSYYRVSAGQNIPGFVTVGSSFNTIIYKSWSDVSLDLTDYLGQNVTIQFTTSDCSPTGHYAYAYIDCKCFNSELPAPYFCKGDTLISFTAPSGYQSYEWKRNYTQTIALTQTVDIIDPQENDVYEVYLTPFSTGQDSCAFKLSHILKTNPHPVLPDYLLKQNVITANADKMNDKMETDRFMYTDKFSIKIYNRWGKLVFESEDYKKEWDCNDSGAGTYYFHATFTNTCYPDKEPVESKGYVQVLK